MGFEPFFGDLRFEAEARALRVKGTLIASRRRYLDEYQSEAVLNEALTRLEDQAREFLIAPPAGLGLGPQQFDDGHRPGHLRGHMGWLA